MAEPARRRAGLSPGIVHAIVAIAILAVIIPLTLRASQASPPAVAEFAPQAQKPITDAPQEQTSRFGNGAGGAGNGTAAPTPTPAPSSSSAAPTIPPNAVLKPCVGNPPRQIEDTQSPPCIPYWQGNNGGATSVGVTATSIYIATNCQNVPKQGDQSDYAAFFNARFEFYNRSIVPVCANNNNGWSAVADEPTARADADATRTDPHPAFGATLYPEGESGIAFYDELSHLKPPVVAAAAQDDELTQSWMQQRPSIFQYELPADQLMTNLGEWACQWLANKPPNHMGAQTVAKPATRKFGVYFTYGESDSPGNAVSIAPLKSALAQCGQSFAQNADIEVLASDGNAQYQQQAAAQLAASGATTVFCLTSSSASQCGPLQRNSTQSNYYPEWIFSTYGIADRDYPIKLFQFPAEQMADTMGLTDTPRQINPQLEPWWAAMHEGNPGEVNDGSDETEYAETLQYHSWLLLAAGIQMAGPNLTPATFAAGLAKAEFPNPPSPIHEGAVGFNGNNHGMTLDLAVWWWNNAARTPYAGDNPGTICYYNHGLRIASGQWAPADGNSLLFPSSGACDSG